MIDMSMLEGVIALCGEAHEYLGLVAFGGMSGIIYLMLTGGSFNFKDFIKSFIVSAFTGLLAGMFMEHIGLAAPLIYVGAGLFGFAGGSGLLWMLTMLHKKLGLSSEEDIEDLRRRMHHICPPESIVSNLLNKKVITIDNFKDILDGDISSLLPLVATDALDGVDFEEISKWVHNIRKAQGCVDDNNS